MLLSHMNSPGRDPRDVKKSVDAATAKFLNKAIEREPGKRYQNPAEFRDALQALPEQ